MARNNNKSLQISSEILKSPRKRAINQDHNPSYQGKNGDKRSGLKDTRESNMKHVTTERSFSLHSSA